MRRWQYWLDQYWREWPDEATPKSGEGDGGDDPHDLKSAKGSAVKARTQAFNQMKALIVTAQAELRETLIGLTTGALINLCKFLCFRPWSSQRTNRSHGGG